MSFTLGSWALLVVKLKAQQLKKNNDTTDDALINFFILVLLNLATRKLFGFRIPKTGLID
jgi:hypothetical protein